MVYKEGLEIVKNEGGWWKWLDIVKLFHFFFLLFSRYCGFFWFLLFLWLFWIRNNCWLDSLGTHLDISKNRDEVRWLVDLLNPWSGVLQGSLSISFLKLSLKRLNEHSSYNHIGESHLVANEVLRASEAVIKESDLLFKFLDEFFPVRVENWCIFLTEDSSRYHSNNWRKSKRSPVDPLINLGLLKRIGSHHLLANSSHILHDWHNSSKSTLFSLEEWVLAKRVQRLLVFRSCVHLSDIQSESTHLSDPHALKNFHGMRWILIWNE